MLILKLLILSRKAQQIMARRVVWFFVCLFVFLFSRQTKKWIVLSGILEFSTVRSIFRKFSKSLIAFKSCQVCDKRLPGAHCRSDGVLQNVCFVTVSPATGENQTCVFLRCWWRLLAPYCHFYYTPLCRTEWRQLDGFISQVRFIYGFAFTLMFFFFFYSVINNLCFTACLWVCLQQ